MCWDLIHGIDRIRPFAFAARPSGPAQTTGFPYTAKRLHLYICAFPDWEYVSAYAATRLHPQRATSPHGYTPTGLHAAAQPNGGRVAHGCSQAMLLLFERGAVGASRSASTGYRLINTNLTSRTNDKEAKLNRSRTETSKTLVFQSRTQASIANKKNSSPIHSVTEEINFA